MRAPSILIPALVCISATIHASGTTYVNLYLNGKRIGYDERNETKAIYRGQTVNKRTITRKILLKEQEIRIVIEEYVDLNGRPFSHTEDDFAARRHLHSEIEFGAEAADFKSPDGSQSRIAIPPGAMLDDDPVKVLPLNGTKAGATAKVCQFFEGPPRCIEASITFKGKTVVDVLGKPTLANWYTVHTAESDEDTYVDDAGTLIEDVESGNQVYVAVSKEDATSRMSNDEKVSVFDVARVSAEGDIGIPSQLTDLRIEIPDPSIQNIPSDDHQTAEKTAAGWTLNVHPPRLATLRSRTIAEAAASKPEWLKPDRLILSGSEPFTQLAKRIVGKESNAYLAARLIQSYVAGYLKYDLKEAMGPMRDAAEVFRSRKGVCGDFALLATTIMRAANIPARLVAGVVSFDGDPKGFYFHGWVSIYDGTEWVDLDPQCTAKDDPQLSASYVELAAGGSSFGTAYQRIRTLKILSFHS